MTDHENERESIRREAARQIEIERETERLKDAEEGPSLVGFAIVVGVIAAGFWLFSDSAQTARILTGLAILSFIAGLAKTSSGKSD